MNDVVKDVSVKYGQNHHEQQEVRKTMRSQKMKDQSGDDGSPEPPFFKYQILVLAYPLNKVLR